MRPQGTGRTAKLTPEQKPQLAALIEAGPDVDTDGVMRWRRVDLQARINELFGVELHERTVGKHLAELDFMRLSVHPQHPKAGHEASPGSVARPDRSSASGSIDNSPDGTFLHR